jgi:hypothetical protein
MVEADDAIFSAFERPSPATAVVLDERPEPTPTPTMAAPHASEPTQHSGSTELVVAGKAQAPAPASDSEDSDDEEGVMGVEEGLGAITVTEPARGPDPPASVALTPGDGMGRELEYESLGQLNRITNALADTVPVHQRRRALKEVAEMFPALSLEASEAGGTVDDSTRAELTLVSLRLLKPFLKRYDSRMMRHTL